MATLHGELDTSVVPGTTHLIDLDGTLDTAHDAQVKDIVLVPTPSADPDDPLNWSQRRKTLHMFCIFMYVYLAMLKVSPGLHVVAIVSSLG